MIVTQSNCKNMGLYNERVGVVHIVKSNKEVSARVLSNLKIVIRTIFSNPPAISARIAAKKLTDKTIAIFGQKNQRLLQEELLNILIYNPCSTNQKENTSQKVPENLKHITSHTGFFTFTGLTPEQCDLLIKQYHVYLLRSGRMSMAGITSKNFRYLAQSIKAVVQNQ